MKQRIAYVDAAKGLGILMIMFGHITKEANAVDFWMSSFKVVIFYIISGFLMSYSGSVKSRSFKVFTGKILKSLAIPYLSFSVLGVLFKTACIYVKHKPMTKVSFTFWEYLWDSVFLKGINSMWFLPTLFIGELVFFFLIRSPKVIKIIYGVAGLFAVAGANICTGYVENMINNPVYQWVEDDAVRLINAVGKGLSAAWFIGAGYILYLYYKKLNSQNIKLVCGLILSVINIVLAEINTGVDFNLMDEGKYPYMFYVCGIIGSLGAIMVLDYLSSRISLEKLDFWGRNSLIVMCTHTVFGMRTVAHDGWKKVAFMPKVGNMHYIIECLIVLVILMMIEYSVIIIVNDKFSFLIGKKKVATN